MYTAVKPVVVMMVVLLCGCDGGSDQILKLGKNLNEQRKARSIPVVPSSWIPRYALYQIDWTNPAFADASTTHKPMHSRKELLLGADGRPTHESDFYESGKQFTSTGGDPGELFWEDLEVSYDYGTAANGGNPWTFHVNCGPLQVSRIWSLDKAEALLKSWGVARLEPE
jgi:hypothetical protein